MNPLTTYGVGLGQILSEISNKSFRFGFEQQFNQIQNTTIKRINSEIDRVIENDDTPRRLAALERDYQKLDDNKKLIDNFHFDMYSNQLRLAEMKTDAADAIAAFSSEDDDTNLTADEVTALTAKRDALIADTEALLLSIHPDISTPNIIRDVKNTLDTLKAMDPVVGVVDAEGSGSPTNANRQILDDLTTFSNLLDTAYEVTYTTADNAQDISLSISASLAGKVADMTQLSEVELKRQEEEIEGIKAHYGNILRVISVTFEARISSTEQLATSLQGQQIQPGSIMNIFT